MLIGLTGGYCAGKNAVAALLEARGFLCFDLDKLGHEALGLEETQEAIAWRFGPGALGPEGFLDRKALATMVFKDPEGLADLEGIVHPAVYRLLRPRVAAARAEGRDVCLNAALLYRMPDAADCDFIIEVRAPLAIRVIRGCARDDSRIRDAIARIRNQRSFWKLRRKSGRPVYYLKNGKGHDELAKGLDALLSRLSTKAQQEEHKPSQH
jgi:dephospho-CoA kinase